MLAGRLTDAHLDREEALKEDYQYDPASYDYGADDEWADEDASWEAEDTAGAESEAQNDGSTYLEFLNEEVSGIARAPGHAMECPFTNMWVRSGTKVPQLGRARLGR